MHHNLDKAVTFAGVSDQDLFLRVILSVFKVSRWRYGIIILFKKGILNFLGFFPPRYVVYKLISHKALWVTEIMWF